MMIVAEMVALPVLLPAVAAASETLLLCCTVLLLVTMPFLAVIAFLVTAVLLTAVPAPEAGVAEEGECCTA